MTIDQDCNHYSNQHEDQAFKIPDTAGRRVRHSLWFRWIHKTGVCGRRLSANPKNWATRACFLSRTQIHYIGLFHDMPCCNNAFSVTITKPLIKQWQEKIMYCGLVFSIKSLWEGHWHVLVAVYKFDHTAKGVKKVTTSMCPFVCGTVNSNISTKLISVKIC